MPNHQITTAPIDLGLIAQIRERSTTLSISEEVIVKVQQCRNYLDHKIRTSDEPVYGVNTGFGSLYKENISKGELEKLQENILKSHACGTGAEIAPEIVRLMLFLKIQSLSYGHSGVQVVTLNRLVDMFNAEVNPIVYEYGSLGASGDLAPLAHMCLPLIDLGEVHHRNERVTGAHINKEFNWEPIHLMAKEGLALLNGTQFMTAFGVHNVLEGRKLLHLANLIGALSVDAYDGRIEPFMAEVHNIRPHEGQKSVARFVFDILQGSEIIGQKKKHVQDPYSFRCIPQVHGATADAIDYAEKIFVTEINSVSDNPNVFPEQDKIISAGNFHGQPLALAQDFLNIALAELGSISERRTFQLISGTRDLPNYLVANPGINSGLMIPQYTAASIVSQNKNLANPSSTDSIVSSNGQEDHVSMGANAATKGYKIVDNLYQILAIELMTAAQALELRRPLKTSEKLEKLVDNFRMKVPFIEYDRVLHDDITRSVNFLKEYNI